MPKIEIYLLIEHSKKRKNKVRKFYFKASDFVKRGNMNEKDYYKQVTSELRSYKFSEEDKLRALFRKKKYDYSEYNLRAYIWIIIHNTKRLYDFAWELAEEERRKLYAPFNNKD